MPNIVCRLAAAAAVAVGALVASSAGPEASELPERLARCQSDDLAPAERDAVCSQILEDRGEQAEVRAEAALNRGLVKLERGDAAAALKDFAIAIDLNAAYPAPHVSSAQAHALLGQLDSALASANAALRLEPANVSALEARAKVYIAMRRPREAIADLDVAIELDTDEPDLYVARARAHELNGDQAAALRDFRKATALDPAHDEAQAGALRLSTRL